MDSLLKLVHSRRRGREQPPKEGVILLADGKTVCKDVVCTAGTLVKVGCVAKLSLLGWCS